MTKKAESIEKFRIISEFLKKFSIYLAYLKVGALFSLFLKVRDLNDGFPYDKSINYDIFECFPALQIWILAATSSFPLVSPSMSAYIWIIFFSCKNDIEDK